MKRKLLLFIAIITVIPGFIWFIRSRYRKSRIRRKIMADGEPDYRKTARNITKSIAQARLLYKKLITEVHPDRIPQSHQERATTLSARITAAKRNYNELVELEKEVKVLRSEIGNGLAI